MVKTLPSNAGKVSSICGQGDKIPHALWPKNQNIKRKQYCDKFSKDLKKVVHIKQKNLKNKSFQGPLLEVSAGLRRMRASHIGRFYFSYA